MTDSESTIEVAIKSQNYISNISYVKLDGDDQPLASISILTGGVIVVPRTGETVDVQSRFDGVAISGTVKCVTHKAALMRGRSSIFEIDVLVFVK